MKTCHTPLGVKLDNAFEQTPEYFSNRVSSTLKEINTARPARKNVRWLPIAAACLVLLGGSALAANSLGVLDFLTGMTTMPLNKAAVENDVSKPLSQSFDGKQVFVQARDYLWNDMKLSMVLHVSPTEPDKYRLIGRGDFGADGIHMDEIWWGDEITTMDKWLPKGKQALVIDVDHMAIGERNMACTVGWVPEELGETYLLEADLFQVTPERYEKLLDKNGNIQVKVPVSSWLYGSDAKEQSTLTITLEAPTVQEWRDQYDNY
jgi:hypothetical protein